MALEAESTQGPKARSVRYPTLDVLRGLALMSMVASHVSLPNEPTNFQVAFHAGVWIDGAFYFVALSGVVTGLVHRRIVERNGLRPSAIKLARRAGFIYLVQIALVVATILVATYKTDAQIFRTETWDSFGDVTSGLVDALLLRTEPNFTGVLSMYVLFLLLAIPAVAALARGWWWAVVGGSIGLYAVGALTGGFTFAPVDTSFDPLGWQLLFVGGLLIGWTWEFERRTIPRQWWPRAVAVAATFSLLMFALARAKRDAVIDALGATVTKFNGGWVAFLYAGAVLLVAYAVLEWLRRFRPARKVLAGVEILGSKGLPGYVAMVLAILVVAMIPGFPRNDVTVVLVVIVCGIAEYTAVRLPAWRRARARARVAAPVADDALPPPMAATPGTAIPVAFVVPPAPLGNLHADGANPLSTDTAP